MIKPSFMNQKSLLHVLALTACLLCSVTAMASEPYAAYNAADKTLTFYYDVRPSGYQATAYYDLNSGDTPPDWYYDETCKSVTHVVFHWTFAQARPTSTYAWFLNMTNLESITGMDRLNTQDVTNMAYMFYGCKKLSDIDLSYFNTANVTNMYGMFYGCSSLSHMDLASFNTDNVTNMGGMFRGCSALETIDLSSFNTGKVAKTSYMFDQCGNLATIYADMGWSLDNDNISTSMFEDCVSLVGGMGTTYDANHTNADYARIDLGSVTPGYFTYPGIEEPAPYAVFTPSDSTLTFCYDNLRSFRPGSSYDLNTSFDNPSWYDARIYPSVAHVVFNPSFADARPTSTFKWFYSMSNLQSITGIEFLNTSIVTYMGGMYRGCSKLTSIDVSGFNTENVLEMTLMFADCDNLTSLDLSSFNTCSLTDMTGMFENSPNLTDIDLNGFNTSKVLSMDGVFKGCQSLRTLDLSSFNTSMVRDMNRMFDNCKSLTTIYVGNVWTTQAVSYSADMFYNCVSLVGGEGTAYNLDHVDADYAHIDRGTSSPGYFSLAMRRGDVNGNGIIEIGDVSVLIDYLITSDPSSISILTADVDADGVIALSDVTALIDFLLNGTR